MSSRDPIHDAVADPFVGTVLKQTYQVLRKIADGGMGSVYEGEHVRLKRRVAIKVLLAQYARHPEVIARFSQEAEIVGSLGHPHIVQVFDVDETEKKEPFLVMEYLEGETLAERLEREHRLPLGVVVRIVEHVASALAGTHEKGIVHRDLKPENVFLVRATGEKEFAKVLDFGISKVRTAGPRLTAHNMVIGTPAYMAPEQARAQREVDHRVDQFALAVMTYEMLSGRTPFPGDDPTEIMMKVITERPPPLSEIASWVPEAVDRVVQRALEKNPDERFPSISEYANALEAAAAGAGVAATTPPAVEAPTFKIELDRPSPPVTGTRRAAQDSEQPTLRASEPPSDAARPLRSRPPTPQGDRPSAPYHERPSRLPARASEPTPDRWVERLTPGPAAARPVTRSPAAPSMRPSMSATLERAQGSSPPLSVGRVERVGPIASRPPSRPPSGRVLSRPPSGEASGTARAEHHAEQARAALEAKRLDDAVFHAEQLLELAVFRNDSGVLDVLRQTMPLVDRVFDARVGPPDTRVEVRMDSRDIKRLNLSPKAAFMLSFAEGGATVQEILDSCGVPRRDAIRMLAGLMRRGALARADESGPG